VLSLLQPSKPSAKRRTAPKTSQVNLKADLYLLTDIDIPWVPEGEQRDRGDRREEMHELFRCALVDRRLTFTEIRGSRGERLEAAVSLIDRLISRHAGK